MRLKAIIRGNEIEFANFVVFNKQEIAVEVEVPDEDVKIYSDEDLEKMSLDELAHFIWGHTKLSDEQFANINKDYKELIRESLSGRYE